MGEKTLTMASKDRTNSGTHFGIMEAFLQITTKTMFNMLISISMMTVKMPPTMMVRSIMEIKT